MNPLVKKTRSYELKKAPSIKTYNGHFTRKIEIKPVKMYKDYVKEACEKDPYFKFKTSLRLSDWVKEDWSKCFNNKKKNI